MKPIAFVSLILIALLAACVAAPAVPSPTSGPATSIPPAQPTATTAPAAMVERVETAEPAVPPTPAPTVSALPSPEDTAAAPSIRSTTPEPPSEPTGAPVAVATVARPAASPATPVPVASPVLSGLGSTEVITPAGASSTTYRVSEISLPTYPYASHLAATMDPALDYPALSFDRSAYEAGNPQPALKTYKLLVLENRYLRVSILPELGGRLYECLFKPTGANELYVNPVVKPTNWGPGSPPNVAGANWWLGAGGMEWGFPVEEHGYEFGTVWGYDHATLDDGSVMITVYTQTGPERPYAVVDIILPPDTAYFVVRPHVVNPLGAPFRFKWWSNAMLAPGRANTVSPELRFIVPGTEMTVHSTGDPTLPQSGQAMPWPVVNGRDLSRLGNWQNYLGAFSRPAAGAGETAAAAFAAVYDPTVDEGIVRVYPPAIAKGQKIFAPVALDPALWTDDGSTYVELHGGLQPTFGDWYELGPGDDVTWSEFWYPVAGIGGVSFADDRAALSLAAGGAPAAGKLRVGLFPTTAITGKLTVTVQGGSPVSLDAQVSPEQPFLADLVLPDGTPAEGQLAITLVDGSGAPVFEWAGRAQLR